MAEALARAYHEGSYWWIAAAILAYVVVEVAAAIRWQILLKVQEIRLSNTARRRAVSYRDVLQPISARRNRRRHR